MIFVDTGYFLALAQPADSLHIRARAWAQKITEPLPVLEYVLWEYVNNLSGSVDRGKAFDLASHILSGSFCEFIYASPNLLQTGLQLFHDRPDKEWSLTDCISFVVMSEHQIARALTFDHHFEQAGFEALLRRDP